MILKLALRVFWFLIIVLSGLQQITAQVLLKNQQEILPVKDIASLKVHFFGEQNPFLDTARMVAALFCEDRILPMEMRDQLHIYFITDIHQVEEQGGSNSQNVKYIHCFLGTDPIDVSWSDAIIYLEYPDEATIIRTVQAIFGGNFFYERLSRSVGMYSFGSGIMTNRQTRLSLPDPQRSYFYRPLRDSLEHLMQEGLDSLAFPGAQLLVLHQGEIALMESYGYHTYAGEQPVKNTDLYDMASITKVTTATPSLMYLYDRKKIDLDKDLCSYFPVMCNSNKADVTLREALAHQGRLQPYIVYWQNTLRKNGRYRARTFKKRQSSRFPIKITDELFLHRKYKRKIDDAIVHSPLNEEPGYVYSGLTFLLFPELVKELTGERIDSFLYKYFYQPLGARRLAYRPTDRFSLDELVPTEVDTVFRRQLVHGHVHDEAAAMLDGLSTNAGLFANALDLGKLCQMLLNYGSYGGQEFISPETVQEFTRYQFPEQGNRRGLGFDKPPLEYREGASYVAKSASPSSYGHSGFTGTFFWIDPENKTVFILLTNRVHPTRANSKLYRMGLRPRMHQAIYDFLKS